MTTKAASLRSNYIDIEHHDTSGNRYTSVFCHQPTKLNMEAFRLLKSKLFDDNYIIKSGKSLKLEAIPNTLYIDGHANIQSMAKKMKECMTETAKYTV